MCDTEANNYRIMAFECLVIKMYLMSYYKIYKCNILYY